MSVTSKCHRLVLASNSPRRRQLLSQFGLEFDVCSADIDESRLPDESPEAMSRRLAEEKAQTVFDRISRSQGNCRVLGGDTAVALGDVVFGKPENKNHAIEMLQSLSGKTHSVFSAVALAQGGQCKSLVSETFVSFKHLLDDEIRAYCTTEDPYDKAGAYGVQGAAGQFVTELQGSYSGVIGLPLWHTHQLLMATTWFSGSRGEW